MFKHNIESVLGKSSFCLSNDSICSSIFASAKVLADSDLPDEDLFDPDETHLSNIVEKLIRHDEAKYESLFQSPLDFEIPEGLAHLKSFIQEEASSNGRLASRMGGFITGILTMMLVRSSEHAERRFSPERREGVLRGILRIARFAYLNTRLPGLVVPAYMSRLFGFVFPSSPSLSGFAFAERVLSGGAFDDIPCLKSELESVLAKFGRETDKYAESMRTNIVAGKTADYEAARFLADLANYRDGKLFSRVFCKFPVRLRTPEFFFGSEMLEIGGFFFTPGEVAFARNDRLKTVMEGRENFFGFSTLALFREYDMSLVPDEVLGMVFRRERLELLGKMCARYERKTAIRRRNMADGVFPVPGTEETVSLADCVLSMNPSEIIARKHFWADSLKNSVLDRKRKVRPDGLKYVSKSAFDAFLARLGKDAGYEDYLQSIFSDEEARTIMLDEEFSDAVCFDPRDAFFKNRLEVVADIPNAWLGTRSEMKKYTRERSSNSFSRFFYGNLFPEWSGVEWHERDDVKRKKFRSVGEKLFSSDDIWNEIEYRMGYLNSRGATDALLAAFLEACFDGDRRMRGYALAPETIPEKILALKFAFGKLGGKTVAEYLADNAMIPVSPDILLRPVSKRVLKALKAADGSLYIDVFLEKVFGEEMRFRTRRFDREKESESSLVFEAVFAAMRDERFWRTPSSNDDVRRRRGELVGRILRSLPENIPHARTSCIFRTNSETASSMPYWMRHEDIRTFILGERLRETAEMGLDDSAVPMLETMLDAWGWGTENIKVKLETGGQYYSISRGHRNRISVGGVQRHRDTYGSVFSNSSEVVFHISYPYDFYARDEDEASQSPDRVSEAFFKNLKIFAEWVEDFVRPKQKKKCA